MSPLVTVHLLRHGEVHNPDRVLYGRLPGFRLSALGARPAAEAAAWLAQRGYDTADEVTHIEERLIFALPQELRRDLRTSRAATSG